MKKTVFWALKAIAGGIIAFLILTLFCAFYYNVPVHSTTQDGSTDYHWEQNKFYSRGTEGFAWGKTNNEGYVNPYDYHEGMDVDVLIMGSSHMEGYNVAIKENTASQLSKLLEDETVYNLGVSAHNFLTCANNLEKALEKYKPQKYVVIETRTLLFSESQLEKTIEGTFEELPSHSGGIVGVFQKIPLFRLLYTQLSNWIETSTKKAPATNQQPLSEISNEDLYKSLLNKLSQTAKEHDVKLIILYHSELSIDPKSGTAISKDSELAQQFAAYCQDAEIEFVNATERFIDEYNENSILPHGFINTSVGKGHLNKHGHRFIAEELFKVMGGEE